MDANQELSLAEVAKMFRMTEEELQRDLEEAHAQIEAGQGIDVTEELLAWKLQQQRREPQELSTVLCEKCRAEGVTEEGMDVFIACLCQACFDTLWKEYVMTMTKPENPM